MFYAVLKLAAGLFIVITHSVRNDFTGLANAALTAWKQTVSNATVTAKNPATAKTAQPIFTLYA